MLLINRPDADAAFSAASHLMPEASGFDDYAAAISFIFSPRYTLFFHLRFSFHLRASRQRLFSCLFRHDAAMMPIIDFTICRFDYADIIFCRWFFFRYDFRCFISFDAMLFIATLDYFHYWCFIFFREMLYFLRFHFCFRRCFRHVILFSPFIFAAASYIDAACRVIYSPPDAYYFFADDDYAGAIFAIDYAAFASNIFIIFMPLMMLSMTPLISLRRYFSAALFRYHAAAAFSRCRHYARRQPMADAFAAAERHYCRHASPWWCHFFFAAAIFRFDWCCRYDYAMPPLLPLIFCAAALFAATRRRWRRYCRWCCRLFCHIISPDERFEIPRYFAAYFRLPPLFHFLAMPRHAMPRHKRFRFRCYAADAFAPCRCRCRCRDFACAAATLCRRASPWWLFLRLMPCYAIRYFAFRCRQLPLRRRHAAAAMLRRVAIFHVFYFFHYYSIYVSHAIITMSRHTLPFWCRCFSTCAPCSLRADDALFSSWYGWCRFSDTTPFDAAAWCYLLGAFATAATCRCRRCRCRWGVCFRYQIAPASPLSLFDTIAVPLDALPLIWWVFYMPLMLMPIDAADMIIRWWCFAKMPLFAAFDIAAVDATIITPPSFRQLRFRYMPLRCRLRHFATPRYYLLQVFRHACRQLLRRFAIFDAAMPILSTVIFFFFHDVITLCFAYAATNESHTVITTVIPIHATYAAHDATLSLRWYFAMLLSPACRHYAWCLMLCRFDYFFAADFAWAVAW